MSELNHKNIDEIIDLIESFLSNEITSENKDKLLEWICKSEANLILFEKLVKDYSSEELLEEQLTNIEKIDSDYMESIFIDCIRENETQIPFFKKYKQLIFGCAAAVVLIATTLVLYLKEQDYKPSDPENIAKLFNSFPTETTPANGRSLIRIGSREKIVLNEVLDTIVFNFNNIQYSNGELIQDLSSKDKSTNIIVETPYNSKIVIRLQDSSIVNVHPGSSIMFPLVFSQAERKVNLTGDALFHVLKKIDKQPFKVDINNEHLMGFPQIKVLGTSFWVNAAQDNKFFETGVLEGVVEVNFDNKKEILVQGKSAITTNKGIETKEFKIGQLYPKMNGKLSWENHEINSILYSLKRWYNIDLDIDEGFNGNRKFTITIDPEQDISESLKILHYLGITYKFDQSTYPNKLYIIN